nr:hypothetical protein 2 [Desulfobulbaceae bacterium]
MKQSTTVSFTVLQSTSNDVGKIIEPDGNGGIIKGDQQPFVVGFAHRHDINFPDAVPIIAKLNSKAILIPGVHDQPKVGVVTRKLLGAADQAALDKLKKNKGLSIVSRTKDHFSYPSGGGMVNLDNDTGLGGKAFDKALGEVIPGYKDCYRILYPSSSSCIHDASGQQLTGDENLHIHTGIADMSDIDRFKKALQVHLWLTGYGYIKISRNGDMLVRSIVDNMAIGPVQPVFAGGAICKKGLTQKRPAPLLKGKQLLNTTKLKNPTTDEMIRFRGMISAAMDAKKQEAEETYDQWKKDLALKYQKSGLSDREINLMLSQASRPRKGSEAILSGSFLLQMDDANLGEITVGELLKRGKKLDRETLADPLEPEEGSGKAKFYMNDISRIAEGIAVIHSHLHGRRYFRLRHDAKSLDTAFTDLMSGNDDDLKFLNDHWCHWMIEAEVDEIESENLLQLLKKSGDKGISSITALRKVYKDKRKQHLAREKAKVKAEIAQKIKNTSGRLSEATDPESLMEHLLQESGTINQNVASLMLQGLSRGKTYYRRDNGSMLTYNEKTGLWVPHAGDEYYGWVQNELRKMLGVTAKFTTQEAKNISEMIRRDEVLANVQDAGGIDYRQKILDAHREWVHFNNGLWNIEEKKFYPGFRKDILLTYGMGIDYVKDACCDKYKQFLMEAYRADSENDFVIQKRRAANQLIIRRMIDVHAIIASFGETRTGKGSQREVEIALAGGPVNVRTTTLKRILDSTFEIHALADGSMISISDEEKRVVSFGLIKPLSSGDPMAEEAKNIQQTGIGARMSGVLVLDANGYIRFVDPSLAPYTRVVPFFHDHTVPAEKRILDYAQKVLIPEELCGIVMWSLGLDEDRVKDLTVGKALWKDPDKVRYLFTVQPEAAWLRECVVYTPGQRLAVGGKRGNDSATAWGSYQEFRRDGVGQGEVPIVGYVDDFKRMVKNICCDFFELDVELEFDPGKGKGHDGRGWYFKNLAMRGSVPGRGIYDQAKCGWYLKSLPENERFPVDLDFDDKEDCNDYSIPLEEVLAT